MTLATVFIMGFVGIVTGVFAGIFGVGGGVVLVPILILGFKYSQKAAIGTSLVALLLPVGLLGALQYFRSGNLSSDQIKVGLIIAVGLFLGTFLGANIGSSLPQSVLQKTFSIFLVFIAIKLWFTAPT